MNSVKSPSSHTQVHSNESNNPESVFYPNHGGDWKSALALSKLPEEKLIDFSVSLNPLGPPDVVFKLSEKIMAGLKHYPDPSSDNLKKCFSEFRNVPKESIVVGNGSNELIHLIPRLIPQGKKCVVVEPAFSEYDSALNASSILHTKYFLKPENDFREDIESFLSYLQSIENLGSIILGNPNSPTGHTWEVESLKKLKNFCERRNILLIIDEAFIDFCDNDISLANEAAQSKNLMVVHSLTKSFCIPGARLGFCILHPEIANRFESFIAPWNINSIAQTIGSEIILDTKYLERTKLFISKEKEVFFEKLKKIKAIKVFPSETNFFLFQLIDPAPNISERFFKFLLTQGLIIRNCGNFFGLNNSFFRIGLKTESENKTLVQAIESFFTAEK